MPRLKPLSSKQFNSLLSKQSAFYYCNTNNTYEFNLCSAYCATFVFVKMYTHTQQVHFSLCYKHSANYCFTKKQQAILKNLYICLLMQKNSKTAKALLNLHNVL